MRGLAVDILIPALYALYVVMLCVAAGVPSIRRETVATVLLLHSALLLGGILLNRCRAGEPQYQVYHFKREFHKYVVLYQAYDVLQLCAGLAVATTGCATTVWFGWVVAVVGCLLCFRKFFTYLDRDGRRLVATEEAPDTDKDVLARWNQRAFLLHAAPALFMLPLVRLPLRCMEVAEWKAMTTWTAVQWKSASNRTDAPCEQEPCTVTQCTKRVGAGVRLESATFAFHMGSALAHLWYCLSPTYMDAIEQGGNVVRWLEYAVTAPVMIVVIMASSGFSDVWVLVCSAILTAVTQAFGWLCELSIQRMDGKHRWHLFALGTCCALPPWIALLHMYRVNTSLEHASIPWYVTAIILSLFVLFSLFALVMFARLYVHNRTAPWVACSCCARLFSRLGFDPFYWPGGSIPQSIHAEKCYIILSFVSKATLAWLLWAGAFRRNAIGLEQQPLPSC